MIDTLAERLTIQRAALMARINRRLATDGQQLRAPRGARAVQEVGFHIISDESRIVATHLDPLKLARELDLLRPFEVVVGFPTTVSE